MGLSSWQSSLKGVSGGELPPGTLKSPPPNSQMVGYLIAALGLAAVLIIFPELVPFILADAAETGAAAEAPAWALDALTNPGEYSPDTVDLARSIVKPTPPPFYDLPPGELPF